MRAFVLVALLCLSVACEEDRPRALGAPYDAGPGGAQATTSRCPTFTGFDRVGRSWHSSTTDEYEAEYRATVSQMSEVVALEDLGDHVDVSVAFEVSISGVLPQGPFIIYTQGSLLYRCSACR